jgi:hypothetical protein
MALPLTITGISTAVAPVGPFKSSIAKADQIVTGSTTNTGVSTGAFVSGQTFTNTGSPYSLTDIGLHVFVGTGTGTISNSYVEIRAGSVTGTVLATSDVRASVALTTASTEFLYHFSAPPQIANGTVYAYVFYVGSSSNGFLLTGNVTNDYAGGAAYGQTAGSNPASMVVRSIAPFDWKTNFYKAFDTYYFFGRQDTTATTLLAMKSTDPTLSFGAVSGKTGFTTAILNIAGYQTPASETSVAIDTSSAAVSTQNITGTGTTAAGGQSFTNTIAGLVVPSVTILGMTKTGTPTGNIYLEVVSGIPGGAVLATSNQISANITAGAVTFTFPTPPTLATGTYSVVLRRTVGDGANYVTVSTGTYAGGAPYTDTGSWTVTTNDWMVQINSNVVVYTPAGTVIHLVVQDGTATSSVATKYLSFDMLTETFLTTTETVAAAAVVGPGASSGCSIVVRSNGNAVILYNGLQTKTSGTFYSRPYYRERTGLNTYGTAVIVDAGTAIGTVRDAILGAGDRVHFLYSGSGAANAFRSISSTNVLDTAVTDNSITATNSVSYVRGANTQVVCAGGSYTCIRFVSGASPTISPSPFYSGGGAPSRLFSDGTDVWLLSRETASNDLTISKSTDDGATFPVSGSRTVAFVGTVTGTEQALSIDGNTYQRGNAVVIPYIVNDNGTWKYNEYDITPSTADAWNIADKSANITLSNADKTATQAATNVATGARSTKLIPSSVAGKFYAEFVIDNVVTLGNSTPLVGIKSSTADVTVYDTENVFLQANGYVQVASSGVGTLHGNATDGTVVGFAWNTSAQKVWFRQGAGSWTNSGDPATNTGGVSISALASANYGLWTNLFSNTDAVSLRTEVADFTLQGPAGFSSWMGEVIPQPSTADAWNVNDKTANITLSNGDKTATCSSVGASGIRSTTAHGSTAGKLYLEMVLHAGGPVLGLKGTVTGTVSNQSSNYVGCYTPTGQVNINYGSNLATLGAFAAGDVLSIAWDANAKLIWFRRNNDTWSKGGDPAAGLFGIDTSALPDPLNAAWMGVNAVGNSVTVRTEKDEFTQSTPTGFLSWMGETLVIPDMGTLRSDGASISGSGFATHKGTGALNALNFTMVSILGISGSGSASGAVPAEIVITGGDGGDLIFGAINYGAAAEGQAFASVGTSVTKVTAKLCKYGVPTDGLRCRISTADANYLPVALLGTTTIPVSSIPLNTTAPVEFTFASPVVVSKDQLYHVAIDRLGAADDENLYAIHLTYGRVYTPMYSYDQPGGGEVWVTDGASNLDITISQMAGAVVPPLQVAAPALVGTGIASWNATGALTASTASSVAGAGQVTTPPAIGTAVLTSGLAALTSFGNVRFVATGVMAPAPATMVSSGVAASVATGVLATGIGALSGLGDVSYAPRTGTGAMSSSVAAVIADGRSASGGGGELLPHLAA